MRLVCIVNAHTPYDGELMEKSAARVGVEIVRYKEGEPWPQDYRVGKLVHGLECIRQLPEDVTHVMFVDSADTLFLAGPEEIVRTFEEEKAHGGFRALVSGERNCYPIAELAAEYPPAHLPWRFVNSGSWIMRREDCIPILTSVIGRADFCDQLCWTKEYLASGDIVSVDECCSLFQSMYLQQEGDFQFRDGRLGNVLTCRMPSVLHWNGTRNEGKPYSRDDVWKALEPSYEPVKKTPTIAILMPGDRFSNHWVFGFALMYLDMVKYFGMVRLVTSCGNNIYQVRENCIKWCAACPEGPPDYVLWLDSDNPPSAKNFALLWEALRNNPIISAVGGWYRFYDALTNKVMIAAGKMGSNYDNITEDEILASEHLIQVPFIGFGMCLMTWKMISDVGVDRAFAPYITEAPDPNTHRTWLTDDAGFFVRAIERGHKIFLHPAVFLEHEKQMNVPASIGVRNETPTLKEA